MVHPSRFSCIDACNACADACDLCASSCLQEEDVRALARCVALDIDCAAICRLVAGYVSRDSAFSEALCQLCPHVCLLCAEECSKHNTEHCQQCAHACRRCADACRQVMAHA